MTRILALHSYRGGTGKSNLTANLASALAMAGARVCIIDTDIASPGVHVLFGLEPDQLGITLNDYLWARCGIEEAAIDVGRRGSSRTSRYGGNTSRPAEWSPGPCLRR